jgi:hypothetical protein
MPCTAPPALSDSQLLTYLDGEAGPEIQGHLARCAACQQRADRLGQLQESLRSRLFRQLCPESSELGELQLGLLPQGRVQAVEEHLTACPHCTRELAALSGYLAELAPTLERSLVEQVVEKVKVLVARLVQGGQTGMAFAPVAAGIRGGDSGPLIYEAGDVQIVLDLQDDSGGPDQRTLLGLLTGMAPDDVRAHLYREGQLVTTTEVDDLGNFVLSDLDPASYELIVSGPDLEVHIQTLDIQR